jgi:lipopolysaccharide assembly outer membrane protein LptD (OstA)
MERSKKLKIIQIGLLISGLIIILFTYVIDNQISKREISSLKVDKIIDKSLEENQDKIDIFYDIEYVGLDLAGNRYILKSKEAYTDKLLQDTINLKTVKATFYFKDDTVLNVYSDTGNYNNINLNMNFYGNVKATYQNSDLYAQRAEYSNSKSMLLISEEVEVKDSRGTLFADKLIFDIDNQKLNIVSNKNNKINTNINLR